MIVAVTGSSGFVGRHVVERLLRNGHSLRLLLRAAPTEVLDSRVDVIVGDMSDEDSLRRLVDGVDAVIHAAMDHRERVESPSKTFRETYLRKNLVGGQSLLEFSAQAEVPRFLFVSTLEVYGAIEGERCDPRDEDFALCPLSLYGGVKHALEVLGRTYGEELDFRSIRPGWVYGNQFPFERNAWHPIVERLLKGEPIPVQVGSYMIWVDDLARACVEMIENESAPKIVNAHRGYLNWFDLTCLAKEWLDSTSEVTGGPAPPPTRPIAAERWSLLGVDSSLEEGLEVTIRHLAQLAKERSP